MGGGEAKVNERRSRSELEKQKWMGGGAEVNERSRSGWEEAQK